MKQILAILLTICNIVALNGQNSPTLEDYIGERFIDSTGREVVGIVVPGRPPEKFRMAVASPSDGSLTLSNVPAYDWSFGCSATSAAMMAGYYDRTSFPNTYTGPTNGGVAPLDNSSWGFVVINGEVRKQCPISATRLGVDGRAIKGHVDDYWVKYNSSSSDPYITGSWTQHAYGECTGDYMKTNQSAFGSNDGTTWFYYYNSGSPFSGIGTNNNDGTYGLKLFFESRGYTVVSSYNQLIYGYNGNIAGCTFAQYKQEIDAGRPVLIHVVGHTMLGMGYDDATNKIYLHDTWDYSTHSMTWGGTYSGMQQYMVSVIQLGCNAPAQPGAISGNTPVCQSTTNTYSIAAVSGATSYTWTLPAGWSGSSTATSITATSGAAGGTISVKANNSCGAGTAQTKSVSVVAVPAQVSVININVLNGQSNCNTASQTIAVAGNNTTFYVQNGGYATMVAGTKINYLPGTKVYSGGYMRGYIATGVCCGVSVFAPSFLTNPADVISALDVTIPPAESSDFKVYPNPTSDNFILELSGYFSSVPVKVDIFGMQGEKAGSVSLTGGGKHEFSLQGKPSGIYFIRITSGKKAVSAKIIKQ